MLIELLSPFTPNSVTLLSLNDPAEFPCVIDTVLSSPVMLASVKFELVELVPATRLSLSYCVMSMSTRSPLWFTYMALPLVVMFLESVLDCNCAEVGADE